MRIFLPVLALCLIVSNVLGATKDDKKESTEELAAFKDGVVYALPQTGFRLHVSIEQEKYFHGPYYQFAEKYLGIRDVPATDSEKWKITAVGIETFGTPDPNEVHKALGPVSSTLSLTPSGILVGVNAPDRSIEVQQYATDYTPSLDVPRTIWPDLSMKDFLEEIDSLSFYEYPSKSLEEKAKEAAHDITKLRKRRFMTLAAGYEQLLPDGSAYEVMVRELKKLEKEYVGLFIGKSYRKTHTYTFEVVPQGKNEKGIVAFRFSPSAGVLPDTDLTGRPVVLELVANNDLLQSESQASNGSKDLNSGNSGLFYRIPGNAIARVLNGGKVLAQARVTIAQFGEVAPIPEGMLDGSYSLQFYPETGAIKKIELE